MVDPSEALEHLEKSDPLPIWQFLKPSLPKTVNMTIRKVAYSIDPAVTTIHQEQDWEKYYGQHLGPSLAADWLGLDVLDSTVILSPSLVL